MKTTFRIRANGTFTHWILEMTRHKDNYHKITTVHCTEVEFYSRTIRETFARGLTACYR